MVSVQQLYSVLDEPDRLSWECVFWDANFIQTYAQAITKIPLGKLDQYTWAWNEENLEKIPVKSAYKLLFSHSRSQDQDLVNQPVSSLGEERKPSLGIILQDGQIVTE